MSQSVSTLTPLDSDRSGDDLRAPEIVQEVQHERVHCSCSRCSLYRWYPPLMLLSTVLAGVFCWMYISKPVFLSAPSEGPRADPLPAFQETSPARIQGDLAPPTAESSGTLDPAVASLPGDTIDLATVAPVGGALLGEELKPLVVKREGATLFKPFVINEIPPGSSLAEPAPSVVSNGEETGVGQPPGSSGEPGADQESVRPEASSDEEDYRVRASFMAEFSVLGDPRGDEELKP